MDKQHHYPFTGEIDLENSFDEVVVFEKSQTLPLYIVVDSWIEKILKKKWKKIIKIRNKINFDLFIDYFS